MYKPTHIPSAQVPLFRTTQWAWFIVAIYYTYGDFLLDIIKNNEQTHETALYWKSNQFHSLTSFGLYSGVFVITNSISKVAELLHKVFSQFPRCVAGNIAIIPPLETRWRVGLFTVLEGLIDQVNARGIKNLTSRRGTED